jgi:hypothetical protein
VDTLISVRAFSNVSYIVYADACARAGRIAEGAEILNVAEHSVTQGDAWLAPEFFRVRGRLRFASGEGEEAAGRTSGRRWRSPRSTALSCSAKPRDASSPRS